MINLINTLYGQLLPIFIVFLLIFFFVVALWINFERKKEESAREEKWLWAYTFITLTVGGLIMSLSCVHTWIAILNANIPDNAKNSIVEKVFVLDAISLLVMVVLFCCVWAKFRSRIDQLSANEAKKT